MQHLLDLQIQPTYQYGTWVQHAGVVDASAEIAQWMSQGGQIWLNSTESAGKTHLLHTLKIEHPDAALVEISHDQEDRSITEQVQHFSDALLPHAAWMIDITAGSLNFHYDSALFHIIAKAQNTQVPLIVSWRCAPADLALSQIASFLQQMSCVHMRAAATQQDKRDVLFSVAKSRQWFMNDALFALLYKHGIVNLPDLILMMEELHVSSLKERRKMSLRWVTQYLKILKEEGTLDMISIEEDI